MRKRRVVLRREVQNEFLEKEPEKAID